MKKVYSVKNGEWIEWARKKNLTLICCDCNLVHDWEFRLVEGKLQARYWRNNRRTAARRRKRK